MDSSSNQTSFSTLTGTYPALQIVSGSSVNTDVLVTSGGAHASVVLDLLFRNYDGSNARNFDIIICALGANASAPNNRVQISVPANAGNNGVVSLASLAALAPSLFDLDLAGNRVITLESGIAIYVRNKAALTADIVITTKLRSF
jgi:hypothetical protein